MAETARNLKIVKDARNEGLSRSELARKHGVTSEVVGRVIKQHAPDLCRNGRTWRMVADAVDEGLNDTLIHHRLHRNIGNRPMLQRYIDDVRQVHSCTTPTARGTSSLSTSEETIANIEKLLKRIVKLLEGD